MTANRKGRKYGSRKERVEMARLAILIPASVKSKADAAADAQQITLTYYIELALCEKMERDHEAINAL